MTGKPCRTCSEFLSFSNFGRCAAANDGMRWNCRKCLAAKREPNKEKARQVARAWGAGNKERVNARSAAYHAANRERVNADRKQRAIVAGPEVVRLKQAAAYRKNRDARRAKVAEYKRLNPSVTQTSGKNRKAKLRGARGRVSTQQLADLLLRQDGLCHNPYCRADLQLEPKHLDHWIPLARGGQHEIENLRYLCAPCNLNKLDKEPHVWLATGARTCRL